jgi:hypothetical protein
MHHQLTTGRGRPAGRRSPPPGASWPIFWLAASMVMLSSPTATAQGLWAAWGATPSRTAVWDPDAFADYLFTGQEPHPAVARIVAPEQTGTAMGSGVLVDVNRTQGLVLTNWHVVRDSRSAVLVQFPDGFQSAGTVIRWDEAWDLAAVVVWKPPVEPVRIAEMAPQIGERLTIAGFGRGAYREESGPCTEYLSPGSGYAKEFVELQATARQGDSGGPIFNANRELAGVLFGQAQGRTIGSCSTRVRTFLASVGSGGFTPIPLAEFSSVPALARGLGTAASDPSRLAASADAPLQRSIRVASPVIASSGPPGLPVLGSPPEDRHIDSGGSMLQVVTSEAATFLSAAGGLALVVLGLRTVFGGRRTPARPVRTWGAE